MNHPFLHDISLSRSRKQPGLLIGVRKICRYCQIGHQTFYNWMRHHDFPVCTLPDGRRCTSKSLIDQWITSRIHPSVDSESCRSVA